MYTNIPGLTVKIVLESEVATMHDLYLSKDILASATNSTEIEEVEKITCISFVISTKSRYASTFNKRLMGHITNQEINKPEQSFDYTSRLGKSHNYIYP